MEYFVCIEDEDEFDDKIRACNGVEFVRKTWIF